MPRKKKTSAKKTANSLPRVVQRSPINRQKSTAQTPAVVHSQPVASTSDGKTLRGAKYPVIPDVNSKSKPKIEKKKAEEPIAKAVKPVKLNNPRNPPEKQTKKTIKQEHPEWSKSITLYDPKSKEFHPYPYITSPDSYLLSFEDDEDQKPPPPLPDEIVERIMLDTSFAKSYVDELLNHLIEPQIRDVALTFTTRQGPANMLKDKGGKPTVRLQPPLPSTKKEKKLSGEEKKTELAYEEICEEIILEEIKIQLNMVLWNELDVHAILLDNKTYEEILSNDRGYTMNPELIPILEQHTINVGIRLMGRENPPQIDHKPFKGIQTKTYLYQFHKIWRTLMTSENYAERELKLYFLNQAIWHYFYDELLKASQQAVLDIDKKEEANYSLNPYSGLEVSSKGETSSK